MFERLKSKGRDLVHVADRGFAQLRNRTGAIIAGREWGLEDSKPVVEVKGWVQIIARERGKLVPGACREGYNIWTNTGREFLAMLMSYSAASTPYRSDRVLYIGAGTGSQPEDAGIISLVQPVEYVANLFLAELDVPPSFPLSPTRTTVRYHRLFTETELTIGAGTQVSVSELGLFTDGNPNHSTPYLPGSRDRTIANAGSQSPVAYKTFDPITKKDSLQLEVSWEIRF